MRRTGLILLAGLALAGCKKEPPPTYPPEIVSAVVECGDAGRPGVGGSFSDMSCDLTRTAEVISQRVGQGSGKPGRRGGRRGVCIHRKFRSEVEVIM